MQKSYYFLIIFICALLFSCSPTEQNNKLTIVTTTGIIADCLENIVGENVEVISLMGAGVDPHLYRASQGDIVKLTNADIIVYNGLHLEGKMAKMLENYAEQKPVFAIGGYLDKDSLRQLDQTSDLTDPHIWFNPNLWMDGITGLAKDLSAEAPELKDCKESCKTYRLRVEKLSKRLSQELDKTLTKESRILITSHDAFSYFGDAFDFQVRGLQGISTAAEHGTKDVKNLIDFIVDNNIKSVFVETSVSDKNLHSVIEGANARDYKLKIGGTLYSDALGEKGTISGTYLGMLEANINTIIAGLK